MKKLARNTLALGTATLIVTAGLSFSANGADATKSYSTGRFLTGSIGGTNLDAIAQLKGVTAANPGNPGANKNPLAVTLLSTLPINIPGGVSLDVAKLLSPSGGSAGAINQYASAGTTAEALGASGLVNDSGAVLTTGGGVPTDAKISLASGPLDPISKQLASVDLSVGALSSSTKATKDGAERAYKIAGLKLDVGVPLIKDLVGNLSTAIAPLSTVSSLSISPADICAVSSTALTVPSSALLAQLDSLGLTVARTLLDAVLNPVLGTPITSVNLCDSSNPLLKAIFDILTGPVIGQLVKVDITGIDQVTTGIANFSSDGVAVDLSKGLITLDIGEILKAAKVDLNNLPPNTDIVSFLSDKLISDKITAILDSAIANIVAKVTAVNIKISVAGTTVPLDLDDITGAVTKPLTDTLTQVTGLVKQVGTPIDSLLAQLAPNLAKIVSLTGNNQSVSKTPTLGTGTVQAGSFGAAAVGDYYRTSALAIKVLNGTVLNVDLAASEAAVVAAPATDQAAAGPAAADDDDSDAPADNADSVADADANADANADADNGDDSDTVADADAQADADVTTTLPSTGAPNLLPFWLLGIALLLFGGAVLVNEKRRLNAQV